MSIFNVFPEKSYKEIITSIGSLHYCVFDQVEIIPGNIFSTTLPLQQYNCVVAGTGDTISDYNFTCISSLGSTKHIAENIVIPKKTEIIVVRLLRHDTGHGENHFNATDQLIFLTKKGNVLSFSRKDAPDHYISIAKNARVISLADAYKLPKEKSGPVENYSAEGASLHIELLPDTKNTKN